MGPEISDLLQSINIPHFQITSAASTQQQLMTVVTQVIKRTNPVLVGIVYWLFALVIRHAPFLNTHVPGATEKCVLDLTQRLHSIIMWRHHVILVDHDTTIEKAAIKWLTQRWVIAIKKKTQLQNTFPIISMLSNWHYQFK